jgi:probable rRNA maturation factor
MPHPHPIANQHQPESRKDQPEGQIRVDLSNTQGFLAVDPDLLAALARRVLQAEGINKASISIALVDNATIRRINRDFLKHDWPTDVISFVLSDPDDPELAGELVISAEMAQAAAAELGAEARAELSLYLVHGLLHLCGYDDARDEDAQIMRAREKTLLET